MFSSGRPSASTSARVARRNSSAPAGVPLCAASSTGELVAGADFSSPEFSRARFSGAWFSGARLSWAGLSGSVIARHPSGRRWAISSRKSSTSFGS
ncbi:MULTISPECIES: pentapeptide repeat-containing protein [Dermacoccus]|uniref:pentapeptide repeat-containing protein n=1 Tax=Dermacoccus TaxID=57495 RepID=UPI00339AB373